MVGVFFTNHLEKARYSPNIYYLFHGTIDNTADYTANYLYLTTIDMNLNSGKGQVTSKNVIKIQDTLNSGRITACKHGNGRDWWIIVRPTGFGSAINNNVFIKYLVDPWHIQGPFFNQ